MKTQPKMNKRLRTAGACMGVILGGSIPLHAQTADSRVEKLEKDNQALQQRLDALEALAKKEGLLPSGSGPNKTLSFLAGSKLSGFVTASYFYDTSHPPGGYSPGYLWNPNNGSFAINKVKLTLEKPAEISGDKWDAGYNVMMIWGEDARFVNTGPGMRGFDSLRQAYVELNVPIGTGLDIKAGQLISLLNFESGDGGATNPNFSQGNQWFSTGNGPGAGVQAAYAFNDWLDMKVRVQNGLYTGAVDNNGFKTFMGGFGIKPDSKTSISLIGFGGRENGRFAGVANSSSYWLKGGSLIASRQIQEANNINVATEFDYFHNDIAGGSQDFWSIGGWVWGNITPKLGAAFRADFLSDPKGFATSGTPIGYLTPPGGSQDVASFTATLNISPVPSIKIQPEVRYEHTSLLNGFGTKKDRFILGIGASYLF